MSNDKITEAANLLLPIQNRNGVVAYHGKMAGPTTQAIALPTAFGNYSQHFYTLVAKGGEVWAALSTVPTGSIEPGALSVTGIPTANAWPIADGERLDGVVAGGRPIGMTGSSATGPISATYLTQDFLLFRTASGVGSALFMVFRTSVGQGAGVEEFYPPGHKRGHYQR